MNKSILPLFGLVAVLFISGCVNSNIPLLGGIGTLEPQTVEQSEDVLVVENLKAIPSQVYTEGIFSVVFLLKHQGDPETSESADNVQVEIYDWGLCNPTDENVKNVIIKDLGSFLPGQSEYIEAEFQAPTNREIAKMQATCPISFKVKYDYTALTQVEAKVISENRRRTLERLGKFNYYTPRQSVGLGPVKIYFRFSEPQPFISDRTVKVFIKVVNKGNGKIEGGKIEKGKFTIEFPSDFKGVDCIKFDCKNKKCTNTEPIDFIGDETNEIVCDVTLPKGVEEKTYYITAKLDYTYSLDNRIEVPVLPIGE